MSEFNLEDASVSEFTRDQIIRLLNRMRAVVFEIDPDGTLLAVNEVVTEVTGYLPEELVGTDWIDLLFPDDLRLQVDGLLERSKSGDVTNYEINLATKDHELIALELNSANEYAADGNLEKIMGLGLDITERKRTEERHRKSVRDLRRAQELARLGTWIWDIPSNTVTCSEELYRIYGLAPEEAGQSYEDYLERVHPEDRARVNHIVMQAYHDLKPFSFEERILRPDGEVRTLLCRGEVAAGKNGKAVRMIGTCHDITEQRLSQQALRESEERYRLLLESVKEYALFTLDISGYVTSWNVGAQNIIGYFAEEIIGQHFSVFYSDEDRAEGLPQKALQAAEESGRFETEGWRLRKDGSQFWANVIIASLRDEDGELQGFSKVVRDMTKRKETEEQLRRSEARFRSVFYGAGVGIELVDLDGNLLEFNPTVCEMFGYSPLELRESIAGQVDHHANIVANLAVFNELRRGERYYYHAERPFLHRDGHLIWGRLTVSLIRDSDGKPQFIMGMVDDITQRKQMEAELAELKRRLMEGREAERLYLAQELHDGPVQDLYSLSYNFSAIESSLASEADREALDKMQNSVNQVVKTLKGISGELRPPALTPFGLEKAIRSYVEEFQQSHAEPRVNLELSPDGQSLPEQVRLVLYRIFQSSFTNVVRHADAKEVAVRLNFDENEAILEVQDDGKGFSVPKRWIELAREGHLGIVGAVERAEAIGGRLTVGSAPDKGTSVRAQIPLKEKETPYP